MLYLGSGAALGISWQRFSQILCSQRVAQSQRDHRVTSSWNSTPSDSRSQMTVAALSAFPSVPVSGEGACSRLTGRGMEKSTWHSVQTGGSALGEPHSRHVSVLTPMWSEYLISRSLGKQGWDANWLLVPCVLLAGRKEQRDEWLKKRMATLSCVSVETDYTVLVGAGICQCQVLKSAWV